MADSLVRVKKIKQWISMGRYEYHFGLPENVFANIDDSYLRCLGCLSESTVEYIARWQPRNPGSM